MSVEHLKSEIQIWARELGFSDAGFVKLEPSDHEAQLRSWLSKGYHGSMNYMGRNIGLRIDPRGLLEGSVSAITVRMDYLSAESIQGIEPLLNQSNRAYIARYALGRDYHKTIRGRLKRLAGTINSAIVERDLGGFFARACTDSAPVLEKRLAEASGLGWIGKNTLLLNREGGSWFFIGELLTNLPFESSPASPANHCGSCTRCLDICPTKAFVGPFELDARKCISYLTIESKRAIPVDLRPAVGNRVFGCDDCQMVCPWNKFAVSRVDSDFQPRAEFAKTDLITLFSWDEATFLKKTEGSAIRRTGYAGWLRNLAVALGNAEYDPKIVHVLRTRLPLVDTLVAEHIVWAIDQQEQRARSKASDEALLKP